MLRASFLVTSAVTLLSLSVLAQNPGTNPAQTVTQDASDWPMYNHDVVGSRCNPAEDKLTRDSVRSLKVKWVFPTKGDVYATPSVVNKVVYAGDTSGTLYALTSAGAPVWKTNVGSPITASALVTDRMVIFGDQAGYIHGLDRNNGKVIWSVRPNLNTTAAIFGSPILVEGQVVIGISSNEGADKASFHGSVVSLDPTKSGKQNWQTDLIGAGNSGSGAGVWSTPTYDAGTGLVYITTGNNYTTPATDTSDAFVALDANTGHIQWTHQCVPSDTGTVEADIGDSPQVYALPGGNGTKVVGAGEKETGEYWVLNADVPQNGGGTVVGSIQAVPSCAGSEGLFADSAVDEKNDMVFVNGVNCSIPSKPPLIPPTGTVAALKSDASAKVWEFTSWFAPVLSGVAVANGVVYFHTSGLFSILYALDAKTGQLLAGVLTSGGISGPSVSNGQIYVGTGTKFASGVPTPTGIVAIGL
jgi:polyvinyl alcohol dehydrogenase (cytochrome)